MQESKKIHTRIALVTCTMHVGGVETYLRRLGRYLADAGYEVDIVTTANQGPWFSLIPQWGLKARHFQQPPRRWRRLHAVRVALAMKSYDVIFLNHAPYLQHALSLLPDKTIVIPVVHNHHDEVYRVAGMNHRDWNAAVAVSPKVYETFRQMHPDRPVRYIPNGVDIPSRRPGEQRALRLPLELIFVGQLSHGHKGVLFLPEIVRGCIDRGLRVRLTVIGAGPDREALETKCRQLGVGEEIVFKGVLPPDEVAHHFAGAHVHLLPSFHEGMPLVLLESQVEGCVPVASHLPGITDAAVQNGVTGFLVAVGDISGFVDALASLHDDPNRWSMMSRSAEEFIRLNRSVKQMGATYESLMRECLEGKFPLAGSRRGHIFDLKRRVPPAL